MNPTLMWLLSHHESAHPWSHAVAGVSSAGLLVSFLAGQAVGCTPSHHTIAAHCTAVYIGTIAWRAAVA